jgi:hypothetical protein
MVIQEVILLFLSHLTMGFQFSGNLANCAAMTAVYDATILADAPL